MPNHLPILIAHLVGLLVLVLGSTHGSANELRDTDSITTVSLHATVRLASEHAELTLGDLATVSGPQADAIEALTIPSDEDFAAGHWASVTIDTIRTLIEQSPGIRAGSVILQGHDVAITRRAPAESAWTPTQRADTLPQNIGPTLRDQLERWVYARPWLKSDADSTRIIFSQRARDQDLLNTPIEGRTVIFNEIGRSKMISCEIVIYENERLITETTIRFDVQIKRQVRVSTAQIRRNELIDDQRSVLETRWISPMVPIADPVRSLGQACKKTIDPGSVLLVSMIEQPILVKRNRIVAVLSRAGSVSVTMSARALNNGRLGELIELESRDGKNRFTARVAGPNRVVIIKNPPQTGHQTGPKTTQSTPIQGPPKTTQFTPTQGP